MFYKYLIKKKEASDNPSVSVYNLLRILDIPATYRHIDKTLQEHPDFPSLLSMAESLPEWGVSTEGVNGEVKYLTEKDYPSIVHLVDNKIGKHFAVLQGVQGGIATIIHPVYGRKTISLDEFSRTWTGILLRAIPGKKRGDPNYKAHLKAQRLSRLRWILTLFGLPVIFLLAFSFGLAKVGMLDTLIPLGLSKAAGFVICIVMVTASLGEGRMMNSLCPMGRIINCHRVIQSAAGRMFGVSIAEWGMLYFAGGLHSYKKPCGSNQFLRPLLRTYYGCSWTEYSAPPTHLD
jgi:ABC-type bacteriocin/lantibiotic exporter with double-glycine peptidase domain